MTVLCELCIASWCARRPARSVFCCAPPSPGPPLLHENAMRGAVAPLFEPTAFVRLASQIPSLNPYPEDNSVLVLDGCAIHFGLDVLNAVWNVGARVEYLEPYDPEHMPIEVGFRAMKDFLRIEKDQLEGQPLKDQLDAAIRAVGGPGMGRQAFHETGWLD